MITHAVRGGLVTDENWANLKAVDEKNAKLSRELSARRPVSWLWECAAHSAHRGFVICELEVKKKKIMRWDTGRWWKAYPFSFARADVVSEANRRTARRQSLLLEAELNKSCYCSDHEMTNTANWRSRDKISPV